MTAGISIDDMLKERERHMLECLRELVSIPTYVPPGENYGKIVDILVEKFENLGFNARRVDIPEEIYEEKQKQDSLSGERANLIATKHHGAKEGLTIYTHLDVVPAGEGWETPPFDVVVRGDRIYGRGTADAKGGVAALLTALDVINEGCLECRYDLCVALTTDEEIGPYSGLCYFADEGLLEGEYMLCMDGENDGVCIATNGILTWEATVFGRSCHSSLPYLGENAIDKAIVLYELLKELKKRVESRESSVKCMPEIAALTGCEHVKPVLNITMIHGGVKENIIPPSCTLRGDRRYTPEEDIRDVMNEFEEIFKSAEEEGVRLEWKVKHGYPPLFTDPSSEWVSRVRQAASAAFGVEKDACGVHGSLDVGYAVERTGQHACVFGVGDAVDSNAHGPNENIKRDDLFKYTKFLILLLTDYGDD